MPVIFDSGVRRGSHVFKALASGADIVAVGRPVLYGLNLGGAQGVASVIEQLNKELTINMMLGGARNIEQVKTTRLLTEKICPSNIKVGYYTRPFPMISLNNAFGRK